MKLSWPSLHLLKLHPVGDLDPHVFGLTHLHGQEYGIADPQRVRLLVGALDALADGEGQDVQRVLYGASKRLVGALAGR